MRPEDSALSPKDGVLDVPGDYHSARHTPFLAKRFVGSDTGDSLTFYPSDLPCYKVK